MSIQYKPVNEIVESFVKTELGREALRQAVVWPLAVRLGEGYRPELSPYEILSSEDFWKEVMLYALTQGLSATGAFLELADQKPSLEKGHPFLRLKEKESEPEKAWDREREALTVLG